MSAFTIVLALTAALAFLAVVAARLDARRHEMSPYLQRWLSQGRGLVILGGAAWLLCVIIFAAALRGNAGVGLSEVVLVGALTLFLLALAGLALLVTWWADRRKRR